MEEIKKLIDAQQHDIDPFKLRNDGTDYDKTKFLEKMLKKVTFH